MGRRRQRRSATSSTGEAILVNQLSVRDAVHLVKTEGGSLSTGRIVFRLATVALVAAFTARAIVLGYATAWHLFLPMVAEYLVLLLSLPILNLFLRDDELKRESRKSLAWLFAMAMVASLWIASRSFDEGSAWPTQAKAEAARLLHWITGHQMHWPILGAAAAMALGMPGRVAAYHRHGPPFMAVGLGCAMRVVIPLFGCFLIPYLASGKIPLVWAIWSILLLAELGALWMHWDLQRRLARRGIAV